MAYKIRYRSETTRRMKKRYSASGRSGKLITVITVFILGCCILMRVTDQHDQTNSSEITKDAIIHMVDDMREGKSIKESVTAFCQEIIDHGKK